MKCLQNFSVEVELSSLEALQVPICNHRSLTNYVSKRGMICNNVVSENMEAEYMAGWDEIIIPNEYHIVDLCISRLNCFNNQKDRPYWKGFISKGFSIISNSTVGGGE